MTILMECQANIVKFGFHASCKLSFCVDFEVRIIMEMADGAGGKDMCLRGVGDGQDKWLEEVILEVNLV